MSAKAVPQIQKSATPTPPVATPMALGSVRAFTDETAIQEQESSSADYCQAAAALPPPQEGGDHTVHSGYNFSRISVAAYVPATVQTKLVVGAPGDQYEQEADAMADRVMSMTSSVQRQEELVQEKPETQAQPTAETVQRQTEEEGTVHLKPLAQTIQRQTEEDGTVHLKPLANQISPVVQQTIKRSSLISRKGDGAFAASESVETRIKSNKNSGQPLPNETRSFMEQRFGNDFSGVKVHTGSDSVQLSKELGAQAFTHGEDVYFNSGKYSPHSDEGKKLLAHELTHTIQQTGPKIKAKPLKVSEKPNKIQAKKDSSSTQPITLPVGKITKLKTGDKIQSASENAKAPEASAQDKDKDKKEEQKDKQNQESSKGNVAAGEQSGVAGGATGGTEGGATGGTEGGATGGAEGGATGGSGGGVEGSAEGGTDATIEPVTIPQETGETAPDSPQADPAFQAVIKQSENTATQYNQHQKPEVKANQAQQAAEDPQKQNRDAEATKVEETSQQKTKPFDRAAFEKAILDKVGIAVPKNLKEADNFGSSNKLGEVQGQLTQQVEKDKQQAAGGLPQANKTPPDPSAEQPKPVEAIPDIKDDIGKQQQTIEADKAVPKEKSEKEIEEPLKQTAENLDQTFGEVQPKLIVGSPGDQYEQEADRMAEKVMAMPEVETTKKVEPTLEHPYSQPDIQSQTETANLNQDISAAETVETEQLLAESIQRSHLLIQRKVSLEAQPVEQPSKEVTLNTTRLETWGELGGDQAITALKDAKKHSQQGPKEYRQQEETQLTTAQGESVAMADKSNEEMFSDRAAGMNEVAGSQEQTKTEDEQKRSEVTGYIEKIYHETKEAVDTRLKKLDDEVNKEFKKGADIAKHKFEDYVSQRMRAYKSKRYSGWLGKLKWVKDKLFGMPDEVNRFYGEGKQVYIDEMKKSVSKIAGIVETGLNEAKERVDKGRQQVNDYVTSLPEDLQEVGANSAADILSKFDTLDQNIHDKQASLVDSLSQKYQENLKELDKRIDQLKEENKGLADKVLDAIAAAAKAIIKAVLTPIKWLLEPLVGDIAGKVIDAIIDDPVKFIKNLFQGIGDGLKSFVNNIGKHLLNGLVSWLFGNIGSELKLPEKFDLKGFLDILLQVLGLTVDNIFGIAEQFLGANIVGLIKFIIDFVIQNGSESLKILWDLVKVIAETGIDVIMLLIEEGAEAIESLPDNVKSVFQSLGVGVETLIGFAGKMLGSLGEGVFELVGGLGKGAKLLFDFFSSLIKDGLSGAWNFMKSSIGTLKEIFMKDLSEMLIIEVVKQGVFWLISMLNPASGLAKIAKAIVNVVQFFVEKKDQIKALVDSILNALKSIIDGNPAQMGTMIETALAQAIPTLLGFLASLLGIGAFPSKIQKIFTKLKEPINKVVTTIFEKGKSFFKGIGTSAKKGFNKAKKAVKGAFKGGKKSNKIKPKVKQNNQGKKTNKPAGKTLRNQAKKIDKPAGRTQQNQGKKQDKGADKTQQNQDKKKDEKAGKKNKDKAQNQFELDDITTLFDDADSQQESTENEEDKEEAMSTDTSEIDDTEEEPAIQRSQQQNQNPMENTSGFNFSNVRIHTDKEGDRLSRSLETPALTTGSSIFFRQGVHPSKSLSDRKLFTHVIQQSGESPPVASSSPLLSRTVQRVSEDAPYFVRRQAEGNSDTVEISVMTDRKK